MSSTKEHLTQRMIYIFTWKDRAAEKQYEQGLRCSLELYESYLLGVLSSD
jgi:hypothetical protein